MYELSFYLWIQSIRKRFREFKRVNFGSVATHSRLSRDRAYKSNERRCNRNEYGSEQRVVSIYYKILSNVLFVIISIYRRPLFKSRYFRIFVPHLP
ncbi:hypothetical protein BABINDRAFT_100667 [Babjeviella inositovora NRRL Y-12698]|uniref:Uncharacterized protein n=1 Tax=Babjeviella inositovora NRRL Y-12698 TaxID=984486 RepID=A0A1E3QID6_9ASCO|nr:uncharacterized protein BABINDRAFT_100667 [Babjeviella inositovora NRRL Y-12698]ODQ77368.1 hypothetical protein BABINDRAFT_100667 [Babjeviella inositovora NRRL Y-12698]